jgi:hypothetical protein
VQETSEVYICALSTKNLYYRGDITNKHVSRVVEIKTGMERI